MRTAHAHTSADALSPGRAVHCGTPRNGGRAHPPNDNNRGSAARRDPAATIPARSAPALRSGRCHAYSAATGSGGAGRPALRRSLRSVGADRTGEWGEAEVRRAVEWTSPRGKAQALRLREGQAPPHAEEEHTSELQSLMRNSYAVFCLKKKIHKT